MKGVIRLAGDCFASCGDDEHVLVWRTNFDRPKRARQSRVEADPTIQPLCAPNAARAPIHLEPPLPSEASTDALQTCDRSMADGRDPIVAALQRVMGQLAIVEERLTVTEDRISRLNDDKVKRDSKQPLSIL